MPIPCICLNRITHFGVYYFFLESLRAALHENYAVSCLSNLRRPLERKKSPPVVAFSALPHHIRTRRNGLYTLAGPDILQQTVALRQAVHGVVALAHGSDEAAEGVDMVLSLDGTAVLVNLGDGDLDGSVVLGLDDTVGRRALSGDVAGEEEEC